MEVVKAALRLGLGGQRSIAISMAHKSHTYAQLLTSAWKLCNIFKEQHASLVHDPDVAAPAVRCRLMFHGDEIEKKISGMNGIAGPDQFEVRASGNRKGIQVGVMANPCAEFVSAMWATWLSGSVVVPLAYDYPQAELLHIVSEADVSLILGTEEYQGFLEDLAKSCSAKCYLVPRVPTIDGLEMELAIENLQGGCTTAMSFKEILTEMLGMATVRGEKPGLIIYTSGTTGKPKGVVHTHAGMAAQVKMLVRLWDYTSNDWFLNCLPLNHVHGLFNMLLAPLYAGAKVELMPKFNVRGVWQRWCEFYLHEGKKGAAAITVFSGVPTMYVKLLQGYDAMDEKSKQVAALCAGQLRLMMCGSAPLPKTVMNQWESITGHRLLERYGTTEFVMALSNPLIGERKVGTVGKPLPGVQVKVVEEDNDGQKVGELCIKSPSMFKEYWRQSQITRDSFREDGFFRTGDVAAVDKDGYYIILGRMNTDIMKVGGFKLSALEIEGVLLEHPAIADCAVVGVPDKEYGEKVCALIVPDAHAQKQPASKGEPVLTLQQLHKWAKERLAPHKIPRQLHVCESLPRNSLGKVNKKVLKQQLLSLYAPCRSK